ncbi:hypothetical protein CJ030_MR4G018017 [Morella rubra]|uniref:Uncharacterized protein n=1 Tax=Morella rubra TaxID=262757 RepID=A0A6A1VR04_9ROSI|nr:hypothetical protein CJ030_MR4G018017 [Morella rubra]
MGSIHISSVKGDKLEDRVTDLATGPPSLQLGNLAKQALRPGLCDRLTNKNGPIQADLNGDLMGPKKKWARGDLGGEKRALMPITNLQSLSPRKKYRVGPLPLREIFEPSLAVFFGPGTNEKVGGEASKRVIQKRKKKIVEGSQRGNFTDGGNPKIQMAGVAGLNLPPTQL